MPQLKSYDKESIPQNVIDEIAPFIADPEFEYERIDKASKACSGVCLWVRGGGGGVCPHGGVGG